jgi:hypothetical protein
MTVLLNRAYRGYIAGAVATFDKPTEDAIIAQGIGVTSTAVPTTGTQAPDIQMMGRAAIPIGAASVQINHPLCTEQSMIVANINQAAADSTLLRVERVLAGEGTFTIYGTANATAAVEINWLLINVVGSIRN